MRQFAVIGLGKYGMELVKTFIERGAQVLALDKREELVEKIQDIATLAVTTDCTKEENLRKFLTQDLKVDVAVVAIGERELDSVKVTRILRDLGVENIVARAIDEEHANILRDVGATEVVFPERIVARQIAQKFLSPGTSQFLELGEDYRIIEIEARKIKTKGKDIVGKVISELPLSRMGLRIGMIKRKVAEVAEGGEIKEKEEVRVYFSDLNKGYEIKEDDVLTLVGRKENVEEFQRTITEKKEEQKDSG